MREAEDAIERSALGVAAVLPIGLLAPGRRQVAEGGQHPDRDAQFNHPDDMASAFIDDGQPAISADKAISAEKKKDW